MPDSQSDGPSTDRNNDPVVDPSENVKALNAAAMRRQDDLREKDAAHLRELMAKDSNHWSERTKGATSLRKALVKAINEKFKSVDMQLALIERQRVEQKADTQKAVDAALAAQKEAVREQTTASDLAIGKSENAMTKQVDQQGVTFATAIAGVQASVGDLKDRVNRIETLKQGGEQQRTDTRLNVGALVGIVTALVGFVSLVVAVLIATR